MVVRYTKKEANAVRNVLQNAHKAGDLEALVDGVCQAFATARDDETKWAIVSIMDEKHVLVFGPYGSGNTARNSIKKGNIVGRVIGIYGMRPK